MPLTHHTIRPLECSTKKARANLPIVNKVVLTTLGAPPPRAAVKIGGRRSTRAPLSRLSCNNRLVRTCYRVLLVYGYSTAAEASPYRNVRLLVQPRHRPVHSLDVRLTAHKTGSHKLTGIRKVVVKFFHLMIENIFSHFCVCSGTKCTFFEIIFVLNLANMA